MIAALGILLFLLAALLPLQPPRAATVRRVLGAAAVLTLLPAVGSSGAWPFVLLGAGAAALAAPLALGLAAAGATVVALGPEAAAPLAAAVAGLGASAAADALGSSLRDRRNAGGDPAVPALVAGALLAAALVLVDHQAVLSWTFGVGAGDARVLLPGVGPVLGLGLVGAVGGVLLLAAGILAPAAPARRAGLAVLSATVVVAGAGLAIALLRVFSLDEALQVEAARPLALLLAVGASLTVLLRETRGPAPADAPAAPGAVALLATRLAAGLAIAAAVAAGAESWWRAGAYATELTAAATATACLGLAALEPERRLAGSRRVLLLAGLLWLLLA